MEVMLIQMPGSISGVLRGDGLKWEPSEHSIRYANFVPFSEDLKTGRLGVGVIACRVILTRHKCQNGSL